MAITEAEPHTTSGEMTETLESLGARSAGEERVARDEQERWAHGTLHQKTKNETEQESTEATVSTNRRKPTHLLIDCRNLRDQSVASCNEDGLVLQHSNRA